MQTRTHNVDLAAVERTVELGRAEPETLRMPLALSGAWQPEGGPQFVGTIPFPEGEVEFAVDFPSMLGGGGAAASPLAYCFFGGLACYAMTFALEAAREGVHLRSLRGTVRTEVDQSRALGLSDRPPVEAIDWELEVEADAPPEEVERLKRLADERCPGAYCIRNPIDLRTRVTKEDV